MIFKQTRTKSTCVKWPSKSISVKNAKNTIRKKGGADFSKLHTVDERSTAENGNEKP